MPDEGFLAQIEKQAETTESIIANSHEPEWYHQKIFLRFITTSTTFTFKCLIINLFNSGRYGGRSGGNVAKVTKNRQKSYEK